MIRCALRWPPGRLLCVYAGFEICSPNSITMWSWCQLVLRILKVYRIDSTQDTFSIRLRSDMLSSEWSDSPMNRFASVSWLFDLTCKRKPTVQQLQHEALRASPANHKKKWRSWIWKLEFKIRIKQSASVICVLGFVLFGRFFYSFCSVSTSVCVRVSAWLHLWTRWKKGEKENWSFSVQITWNHLQWTSNNPS